MKNIKNDIKHTIFTHADLLAERHADYVYEFVTRANDELYAILAELLALYEKIESLLDNATATIPNIQEPNKIKVTLRRTLNPSLMSRWLK